MKKSILMACFALFFFFSSAANSTPPQKIIKITNGEWAPFMSQLLPHDGFVSHIVSEAFKTVGVKVEYGFFPWIRAYNNAQGREWDCSIAWYYSDERAEIFYFSVPVFIEKQVLFFLKSKPIQWNTINDLKKKRIGAVFGYIYGEEFKKAEETGIITVDRVQSDTLNIKKLLLRRVDTIAMSQLVGINLLRNKCTDEVRARISFHPTPLNEGPLYLIAAKNNPQSKALVVLFNKGLGKLKENGKFSEITFNALKGRYVSN